MPKKSQRQSAVKASVRRDLLGPPPILDGEDLNAYNEILDRVFNAVGATDFIDEILAHDISDAAWSKIRWRRVLAAFVNDQVQKWVDDEAFCLASAQAKLLGGPEKENMDGLLEAGLELSAEERAAKYPHAHKKFKELFSAAKSTLNLDLIQAEVSVKNLDTIERLNDLIAIAQRRIDEVVRELDRRRYMRAQLNSFQDRQELKLATGGPKLIEGKALNKKVA